MGKSKHPEGLIYVIKKGRKMEEQEKEAIKVSKISITINIILSLIKVLAGIFARSYAMISDRNPLCVRRSKLSHCNNRSKNSK